MENKWINKKWEIKPNINIGNMINRLMDKEVDNPIVIPEYQRDYVWKDTAVPELLASLYKGFPIGSIIVWDYADKDEWLLIDGLQRNWTLYKIYEKPLNYISFEIFKSWMSRRDSAMFDFEPKIDSLRFKHLKSKLHHKSRGYKKAELSSAIKWIEDSDSDECNWNKEAKEKFKQFLNDYMNWFNNEFLKINVPHHVIKDSTPEEVSEIFEIVNKTGIKLSRFEIISAAWSKHKISIGKEIKWVDTFNKSRFDKYKNEFETYEKLGKRLIHFDSIKIQPSNFIYALIVESFKDFPELRSSFLRKNENNDWEVISKAVEPASEIIIHILKETFSYGGVDFKKLGIALKEKIKTEEDLNLLVDKFKEIIKKTISSIEIISFARNNKNNIGFDFPAWLISTSIIHILHSTKPEDIINQKKWFVYELFISTKLHSGTGDKAKEIIDNLSFNKNFEKETKSTIIKEIKSYIDTQKFMDASYSSRNKVLILSIIQKENFTPSNFYHVDHLIPNSFLKSNKMDNNNLFVLQMKPHIENIKKSNKLTSNQLEEDVFKNHYTDNEKEILNDCYSIISENFSENSYNKIISIRKRVMIEIIENSSWI